MATTGSNFVVTGGTASVLVGSTVSANPQALALDPVSATDACNAGPPAGSGVQTFTDNSGTCVDRVAFDLSLLATPKVNTLFPTNGLYVGNFAKNGMLYFTLTGTTAVTIDFTSLSSSVGVTSSQAGDTSLATINCLIIRNLSSSASTITVAPGASNPLTFPLAIAGTTPTISLLLGDVWCQNAVTGKTVDGTHKTVTFTPTAGGAIAVAYAGA
jgi:hypothetical protein